MSIFTDYPDQRSEVEIAADLRPLEAESVLKAIDKAWDMVTALCAGRQRWTMSVPADYERDPDLVIGEALEAARTFIKAQR